MAWRITEDEIKNLPKHLQDKLIPHVIDEDNQKSSNDDIPENIDINLDEWNESVHKLMLEFYDARRNGTINITEEQLLEEIDNLTSDYMLTVAMEIIQNERDSRSR